MRRLRDLSGNNVYIMSASELSGLLYAAIDIFIEHRDLHGYSKDEARRGTVLEILETAHDATEVED